MLLAVRAVSGIPYRGMSRHRAGFFRDPVTLFTSPVYPAFKGRPLLVVCASQLISFYSAGCAYLAPLIGLTLIGRQTNQRIPVSTSETRIHGESPTVKGRAFFVSGIRDPQLINLSCYTYLIPFESRYKSIVYRSKVFLFSLITGHIKTLIFLKFFIFQADITGH